MEQNVRTRQQAIEQGLSTYFTGKSCKYGHVVERFVSSRACIECQYKLNREYHKDNPEILKRIKKNYRRNNLKRVRELTNAGVNRWYYNNHEDVKVKNRSRSAKRRAMKRQRTRSYADLEAIDEFYRNCPEGYEVDHIVPLNGKLVSGLHVLENLQYLTPSENRSKNNTFEVTEWNQMLSEK